ncbi:MAG: transposase [Halobacteriovoraceae bacterium]|nr:transposase [Halobacteriovoraceae bacterium]
MFVEVDPKYTSQTCPKCDEKLPENRDKKKQFEFKCQNENCNYEANADIVGLKHNIEFSI